MLMNDDIESLNMIIGYSYSLIKGEKDINEYYDDILKELLILKGYNKNKVYEYIDCGECMKVLDGFGRMCIDEKMSRKNG